MVRQEDYRVGRVLSKRKRRIKLLLYAAQQDAPGEVLIQTWKPIKLATADLQNINLKSLTIQSTTFNLNIYSEEQSLHDFRFKKSDVGRVCGVISWTKGRTKRNRYVRDDITACCIVLRRLSSCSTWYDLEPVFGMHYSALSEVFWEALERFVEAKGYLLNTLQVGFLQSPAEQYANAIASSGDPLDNFVGFIDCTKIRITGPGGHGTNQRACYSGHKRMHCLIYQTIATPDGFIFNLYGPEVGRRHDLTLLRNSGVQETLESCLVIEERQFYIYGDAAYVLRPWLQKAFERLGATA